MIGASRIEMLYRLRCQLQQAGVFESLLESGGNMEKK
jgi:hypothetical protein